MTMLAISLFMVPYIQYIVSYYILKYIFKNCSQMSKNTLHDCEIICLFS